MIRFSCSDYTFPLLSPAQRFPLLRLLGFDHVDIGLFERSAGLEPSQLLAGPKTFTRKLKRDLEKAELRVSDLFLQIGIEPSDSAANDPSVLVRTRNREVFLRALELCIDLGGTHLTGLPGVWHNGSEDAADFALTVDEACWRQDAASNAGVGYAIEPHVGSLCSDIASTRALLDSVPGLTLTLDYGHFVSADIGSRAVHALLPFASHIHVRGGARNHLQSTVSENEIDFAGMIRRLYKHNYRGFLATEYVWVDWERCNRTDNVSETLLLRRQLEGLMRHEEQSPKGKS